MGDILSGLNITPEDLLSVVSSFGSKNETVTKTVKIKVDGAEKGTKQLQNFKSAADKISESDIGGELFDKLKEIRDLTSGRGKLRNLSLSTFRNELESALSDPTKSAEQLAATINNVHSSMVTLANMVHSRDFSFLSDAQIVKLVKQQEEIDKLVAQNEAEKKVRYDEATSKSRKVNVQDTANVNRIQLDRASNIAKQLGIDSSKLDLKGGDDTELQRYKQMADLLAKIVSEREQFNDLNSKNVGEYLQQQQDAYSVFQQLMELEKYLTGKFNISPENLLSNQFKHDNGQFDFMQNARDAVTVYVNEMTAGTAKALEQARTKLASDLRRATDDSVKNASNANANITNSRAYGVREATIQNNIEIGEQLGSSIESGMGQAEAATDSAIDKIKEYILSVEDSIDEINRLEETIKKGGLTNKQEDTLLQKQAFYLANINRLGATKEQKKDINNDALLRAVDTSDLIKSGEFGAEASEMLSQISNFTDSMQSIIDRWVNHNKRNITKEIPEQFMVANDQTGFVLEGENNQVGGIKGQAIKKTIFDSHGQANSIIHSHPDEQVAAFSFDDIQAAIEQKTKGLIHQYVVSLNDISFLDVSQFTNEQLSSIVENYKQNAFFSVKGGGDYIDTAKAFETINTDIDLYIDGILNDLRSFLGNDSEKIDFSSLKLNIQNAIKEEGVEDVEGFVLAAQDAISNALDQKNIKYDLSDLEYKVTNPTSSKILQSFSESKLLEAIKAVTPEVDLSSVYKRTKIEDYRNGESLLPSHELVNQSQELPINTEESEEKMRHLEETIKSLRAKLESFKELGVEPQGITELQTKVQDLEERALQLSDELHRVNENSVDISSYQQLESELEDAKEDARQLREQIDSFKNIQGQPDVTNIPVVDQQNEIQEELRETTQAATEASESIKKVNDSISLTGYHRERSKWDGDAFDFSKTRAAQMGSGMYFVDSPGKLEPFMNRPGGDIKQTELNLEKCFILTQDYISSINDINKILGTTFNEATSAKEVLSAIRSYNTASKENSDNFRQSMLSMGYQGMYVGDNLANKMIPDELVVYDEKLLGNLSTVPASEFKQLKESATEASTAIIQLKQAEEELADQANTTDSSAIIPTQDQIESVAKSEREVGQAVAEAAAGIIQLKQTEEELIKTQNEVGQSGQQMGQSISDGIKIDSLKDGLLQIRDLKQQLLNVDLSDANGEDDAFDIMGKIETISGKLKELYSFNPMHHFINADSTVEDIDRVIEKINQLRDGKVFQMYRGTDNAENPIMSLGQHGGGTFFTDDLDSAKYYGLEGKLYEAKLLIKDALEFIPDVGSMVDAVTFTGDGSDEISKRLQDAIKFVQDSGHELYDFRNILMERYNEFRDGPVDFSLSDCVDEELKQALQTIVTISEDVGEIYGVFRTMDTFAEKAKKNGYDSLIVHDVEEAFNEDNQPIKSTIGVIFDDNQLLSYSEISQHANLSEKSAQSDIAAAEAAETRAQANEHLAESEKKVDAAESSSNGTPNVDQPQIAGNQDIDGETSKFDQLRDKIATDIPSAIETKNQAFREEQSIVEGVIQAEIDKLSQLEGALDGVANAAKNKTKAFQESESTGGQKTEEQTKKDAQYKQDAQALRELSAALKEYESIEGQRVNRLLKTKGGTDLSGEQEARKANALKEIDRIQAEWNKTQEHSNSLRAEFNRLNKEFYSKKSEYATTERAMFNQKLQNDIHYGQRLTTVQSLENEQALRPDAFSGAMEELKQKAEELKSYFPIDPADEESIAKVHDLSNEIEQMSKEIRSNPEYKNAKDTAIASLSKKAESWAAHNTAAINADPEGFERIRQAIKEINTLSDQNAASNMLDQFIAKSNEAGKAGMSFIDTVKKRFVSLGAYLASFASFYRIVGWIRQAIQTVKELDTAMMELKKVSSETAKSYSDFMKGSFDQANAVGGNAKQIIESTAAWKRLGKSFKESQEAAQASVKLLNVSEFDNIDDATTSLISMRQAFKDNTYDDFIDKLNGVGDSFSSSTDQIAAGMRNISAVLKVQGNDIDESIALLTAANDITQDMSKASMGVRTIALRIAGTQEAKQELEDLGEDVSDFVVQTQSKVDAQVRKFTATANNPSGISVLDETGRLRNTYDILLDISRVYSEIVEKDNQMGTNTSNALLELLAGKTRSNILASILQNPDLLEQAYETSKNSKGVGQRELDIYLDSVQAKITQLQNRIQELTSSAINSDFLKIAIEGLTKLVELANQLVKTFGALPTILGAASSIFMQKNGSGLFSFSSKDGFKTIFDNFRSGAQKTMVQVSSDAEDIFKKVGNNISQNSIKQGLVNWEGFFKKHDVQDKMMQSFLKDETIPVKNLENYVNYAKQAQGATTGFSSALNILKTGFAGLASTLLSTIAITVALNLAFKGIQWVLDNVIFRQQTLIKQGEEATQAIEDRYNAYKKLGDAMSETSKQISGKEGVETTEESIETIAKRYDELHDGVNELNNANESLSTEKYQEYLDLCNQLAEQSPSLVTGWDAQGNAILGLGNTAAEAEAALMRMYQAEKLAANIDIAKDIQDSYTGFDTQIRQKEKENITIDYGIEELEEKIKDAKNNQAQIDDAIRQFNLDVSKAQSEQRSAQNKQNRHQFKMQQTESLDVIGADSQAYRDLEKSLELYGYTIESYSNANEFLQEQIAGYIGKTREQVQAILDTQRDMYESPDVSLDKVQQGIVDGFTSIQGDSIKVQQNVEGLQDAISAIVSGYKKDTVALLSSGGIGEESIFNTDLSGLSNEQLTEIQKQVNDYIQNFINTKVDELQSQLDGQRQKKQANELYIQDQAKSIQGVISKYLTTSDVFTEQSDEIQNAILNNLDSLDLSAISEEYGGQIVPYIYGELIQPINDLAPVAQKALAKLFEIKPDKKSANEYVKALVNQIHEVAGDNKEAQAMWEGLLGVDKIQDEISSAQSAIRKEFITSDIYGHTLENKLTDEQLEQLYGLSLDDLRIYVELVREGIYKSWEELQKAFEERKKAKPIESTDTLVDLLNNEEYSDQASKYESNLSSLASALETLRTEGSLTADTMLDLQEAMPNLTDFSYEGINSAAIGEFNKWIDLLTENWKDFSTEGLEQLNTYIQNLMLSYQDLSVSAEDATDAIVTQLAKSDPQKYAQANGTKTREAYDLAESQIQALQNEFGEDLNWNIVLALQDYFTEDAEFLIDRYKEYQMVWDVSLNEKQIQSDIENLQAKISRQQAQNSLKEANGGYLSPNDYQGIVAASKGIVEDRRQQVEIAKTRYNNVKDNKYISQSFKDGLLINLQNAETEYLNALTEATNSEKEQIESQANGMLQVLKRRENDVTAAQNALEQAENQYGEGNAPQEFYDDLGQALSNRSSVNTFLSHMYEAMAQANPKYRDEFMEQALSYSSSAQSDTESAKGYDNTESQKELNKLQEDATKIQRTLTIAEQKHQKVSKDTYRGLINNARAQIKYLKEEQNKVKDNLSEWRNYQDQIDSLNDSIYDWGTTLDTLVFDQASQLASAISSAMSESVSETGLTTETINALLTGFSDLTGKNLDVSDAFYNTADGVKVNTQALQELTEAEFDLQAASITSEIERTQAALDQNPGDSALQQKLQKLMQTQAQYFAQYEEMQKALSYNNAIDLAEGTANAGANYDKNYDRVKTYKEAREKGLIGTDEFKAWTSYLDVYGRDTLDAYDAVSGKIERYFTENAQTGLTNFLTDMKALGYAAQDANGYWTLAVDDYDAAAKDMQMGSEWFMDTLRKLEDFGMVHTYVSSLTEAQLKTQDAEEQITEAMQTYGEMVRRGASEEDLQAQIDHIHELENAWSDVNTVRKTWGETSEANKKKEFLGIEDQLKAAEKMYAEATTDAGREQAKEFAESVVEGWKYGLDQEAGDGIFRLDEKSAEDYASRIKKVIGSIENPLSAEEMGISDENVQKYEDSLKTVQERLQNGDLSSLQETLSGMTVEDLKNIDYSDGKYTKGFENAEAAVDSLRDSLGLAKEDTNLLIDVMTALGLIEGTTVESLPSKYEELEQFVASTSKGSGAGYQISTDLSGQSLSELNTQMTELKQLELDAQLDPDSEVYQQLQQLKEDTQLEIDARIQQDITDSGASTTQLKAWAQSGDRESIAKTLDVDVNSPELDQYIQQINSLPDSFDMAVHIDDEQFTQLVSAITDPWSMLITADTSEAEQQTQEFQDSVEKKPIIQTIIQKAQNFGNAVAEFFGGGQKTETTAEMDTSGITEGAQQAEKATKDVSKAKGTATADIDIAPALGKIAILKDALNSLSSMRPMPIIDQTSINNAIVRAQHLINKLNEAAAKKDGLALGTAHSLGTTTLSRAYANGKDWTVGKNEKSLVNEIGQESRVRDGVWELIPGGPHVEDLRKDDIIFNAQQTADLIRTGKTARSGRLVARANGTVNGMSAHALTVTGLGDFAGFQGVTSTSNQTNSRASATVNTAANKTAKKTKKALDKFNKWLEKLFDWIEVRLDRIQRRIDLNTAKAENAVGSLDKKGNSIIGTISSNKNKLVSNAMGQIAKSYADFQNSGIKQGANGQVVGYTGGTAGTLYGDSLRGALRYQQQANAVASKAFSLGIFKSKSRKSKDAQTKYMNDIINRIQKGTIDISQYDEKVKKFIESYSEWYNKSQDLVQSTEELKQQYKELQQTKLDNITEEYETLIDLYDAQKSTSESWVSYLQAFGENVNTGDRKQLLTQQSLQNKTLSSLQEERKNYYNELKNAAKLFGTNSNEYRTALKTLEDIDKNIIDTRTSIIETNHAINELAFTVRDFAINRLQTLVQKVSTIASLAEKRGTNTALGYSVSEGTYSQQIDLNQQLIDKYYEQIINKRNELLEAIEKEGLRKDSPRYEQETEKIANWENQILSLLSSNEDLRASMRNLRWKGYAELRKQLDDTISDLEHIQSLIRDGEIFDDDGALTDRGFAKVALIGEEMLVAEKNIANARKALDKLDMEYENGVINLETYNEEVDQQIDLIQDNAKAIQDYQEQLANIKIDQMEKQNEVLQDLIQARKEALDAKKEYYDWDKTLKNKNKDIAQLQAQINALNGVTNDAAIARRAKLEAQLAEAQEDLNDTLFEHSIEIQQQGYEQLSEDMQEALDNAIKLINGKQDVLQQTADAMLAQLKTNNVDEKAIIESIIEDRATMIHDATKDILYDTLKEGAETLGYELGVGVAETIGENIDIMAADDAVALIDTALEDYYVADDHEILSDILGNVSAIENAINSNENIGVLEQESDQQNEADQAAVQKVIDAIEGLKSSDKLTLNDKSSVENAAKLLGALTQSQKDLIDSDKQASLNKKLSSAQSTINELSNLKMGNNLTLSQAKAKQKEQNIAKANKEIAPIQSQIDSLNKMISTLSNMPHSLTGDDMLNRERILEFKSRIAILEKQISDIKKKYGLKKGAKNLPKDLLAWTNEDWDKIGSELIIRPDDNAILTPLKANDSVIPANLADNLFKWGAISPDKFITNPFVGKWGQSGGGSISNSDVSSNASQTIEMHFDSLFHIEGNVDESVMPRLENLGKTLVNDRDFQKNVIKFVTKDFVRESKKQGIR